MSQIRLRKSSQSESGSKQLYKKSEMRRDFSGMPRNSQVALITGESKKRKLLLVLGTTCVVFLCTAVVFGSLYAVSVSKQHSSASVNKQTNGKTGVCCKGLKRTLSPWSYKCVNGRCIKSQGQPTQRSQQLTSCKLSCGQYGGLWPRPRNNTVIGKSTISILSENIILSSTTCGGPKCTKIGEVKGRLKTMIASAFGYFVNTTKKTCLPDNLIDSSACSAESKGSRFYVNIMIKSEESKLTLATSEAYKLIITSKDNRAAVNITADTFFGARHGLETLSQLISYDELSDSLQIVSAAQISDSPMFPLRGLMLDTSRNFFSMKSILRQLDAMSYNKLNTFHWHITDTHSFPIFIKDQPEMSLYGAYSQRQVYSIDDIKTITEYALLRGIRVLPEFDQPAHAGNGWQWGKSEGKGDMALCVNSEPWQSYCVEPPCGQLNPLNNNTYDVLGKIYSNYLTRFKPDLFHFGGDEVNINCWNTSSEIIKWMESHNKSRSLEDFLNFWNMFLVKAVERFKIHDAKIPLILWSSKMTEPGHLEKYLNNQTFIIHLWNKADTKSTANVLNKGFRVIFSNYDHVYLDCGFGSWVSDGNNWCSPYKEWQLFYNLSPRKFMTNLNVSLERLDQVLGGEANMWSEQVDEHAAEMKVWPRVAGLAERLWTDPDTPWSAADERMLNQRQRLVERGIQADALKPLWCYQNAGMCKG